MTDPITPPPELVQEWIAEARTINDDIEVSVLGHRGMDTPPCAEAWATAKLIAELRSRVEALEAARRPKSPSLKKQALRAAQSRVVTITLNEDELVELKEQLGGIYELWDSSGEELRECYASSVIGKLWSIL